MNKIISWMDEMPVGVVTQGVYRGYLVKILTRTRENVVAAKMYMFLPNTGWSEFASKSIKVENQNEWSSEQLLEQEKLFASQLANDADEMLSFAAEIDEE